MASFLEEFEAAVERDGHLPAELPEENAPKFDEGADDDLDGWVPAEE